MNPILLAVLIVTVIGLIGAVILVAASIFMYVPVDERVEQITGCLPGANCGACGCAGCADYAKTIAYSPYISELNGDNRERYRETLVQLCHEIEPIYSSLKNNN